MTHILPTAPAPLDASELIPTILVWAAFTCASAVSTVEETARTAGLSPDALLDILAGEGITPGDLPRFYAWVGSAPIWTEAWASLCDDMEVPPAP